MSTTIPVPLKDWSIRAAAAAYGVDAVLTAPDPSYDREGFTIFYSIAVAEATRLALLADRLNSGGTPVVSADIKAIKHADIIISATSSPRFLTRSIEHYRLTLGCRRLELSWTEMFGLIVPPDKASLTGIEVDSVLNCDPNHRLNLIRARELLPAGSKREAGETGWCRGRNCGASVTPVSVEKFLRKRQL